MSNEENVKQEEERNAANDEGATEKNAPDGTTAESAADGAEENASVFPTASAGEETTTGNADGQTGETEVKEGKEKHGRRELRKAEEEIARLKTELDKVKAETEEITRKWYSVSAEYDNYRRRTQTQSAQRYAEGRNDVVASLFPVGDNLERALAACTDDNTRQGLEMILKSYKKVLEGENIEELDPTGQPFDTAVAEAIMAVPAEEGEEAGTVKQVYVKGYKRGDKVLRYAQVVVTQ